MTTIQFAGDTRPAANRNDIAEISGSAGGIYTLRERSHLPSVSIINAKNTPVNDEDPGLHEEGDYKQRQVRRIV